MPVKRPQHARRANVAALVEENGDDDEAFFQSVLRRTVEKDVFYLFGGDLYASHDANEVHAWSQVAACLPLAASHLASHHG